MARKAVFDRYPKLTAVTPSRWLAATAREGLWHDHRIEIIPYGVPLGTYRVLRRDVAREALGVSVSPGRPVLLIAAHDLGERRKGGTLLVKALESLRQSVLLLVLGHGHIAIDNQHVAVQHLGYVADDLVKMLAYNAADLLVHPAPVDNLPNVVMEAVACGTPVVGFPIGGMPDMVRPKQTGWLATEVSSPGLAHVLNEALADVARGMDYRDTCRAIAEGEYDSSIQAERYIRLFRSLMSWHKNTAPTSTEKPEKRHRL
jgi:glycosyltransferase involved in cell wall biosynthesis